MPTFRTIGSPALDIMGRAYSTYRKTVSDMNKLSESRTKLKQDKELSDARKKKDQADLDIKKLDGSIKKNKILVQEAMLKEYYKQQDDIYKGKNAQVDATEAEVQAEQDASIQVGQAVKNSPEGQAALGGSIANSGSVSPLGNRNSYLEPTASGSFKRRKINAPEAPKVDAIEKIYGEIDLEPSNNRKDLEELAQEKLGINWKTKFPEAKKIIDLKAGPEVEEFNKFAKENGIKTGRQAVEYLVSRGMEQKEAVSWVQDNIKKKK